MSLLAPSFNTGTYVVTRASGPGTVDALGRYSAPATITVSIQASVQALSGRNLKDLPEGRRAEDYREVFTNSPIYEVQPAAGGVPQIDVPDLLTINGEKFRVIRVKFHGVLSGHYRAVVERTALP